MRFHLESSQNNEVKEVLEVEASVEQLSEMEDIAENFEDCEINLEEIEEKTPELVEDDYDDFLDCGKETDEQYDAETVGVAETDYFMDEINESEVLAPFRQENWEQMTVKEQRQAVEKLADYHAAILGVGDKPGIVYYRVENTGDFGMYSAEQNEIYINEYNMYDAEKTADTISHEYRHKYQHERAEKLETEQDLAFQEGFDNYIRPEDDYQGYKEQLVEADARAYAQAIKEKIALADRME